MTTKHFTPYWSSKPIEISEFMKTIEQLRRTGESDNAISKLLRSAKSESGKDSNENAAFFYFEAAKMLSESKISVERKEGYKLYTEAGYEYEKAAGRYRGVSSKKCAELWKLAGDMYGFLDDIIYVRESVRCYKLAGSFYKEAANESVVKNDLKEITEKLWLSCAESNTAAVKKIESIRNKARDDNVSMAELLEKSSDSYSEIGSWKKSAEQLSSAVTLIKTIGLCPNDDYKLILRLLEKAENAYLNSNMEAEAAKYRTDYENFDRASKVQFLM